MSMGSFLDDHTRRHGRSYFVALSLLLCLLFVFLYQNHSSNQSFGLPKTLVAPSAHDSHDDASSSSTLAAVIEETWPTDFDLIAWNTDEIRAKCDATEWKENIYMHCNDNPGGFGNVRNLVMTCIRYAIESGTPLVMPRLWQRSTTDISDLKSNLSTLDHLFDVDFLKETVRDACPQLQLIPTLGDIPFTDNAVIPPPFSPRTLRNDTKVSDAEIGFFQINEDTASYREWFDSWLEREFDTPSYAQPLILRISPHPGCFFEWPLHDADPADLWYYLGRILRPRLDAAILAHEALTNLEGRVAKVRASKDKSHEWPSHHANLSTFYGSHLRAEADVPDSWGPDGFYTDIINEARAGQFHIIFVATGSNQNYLDLKKKAKKYKIEVVDKHALLSPASLKQLEKLQFDQLALIDFLILCKSAYFSGARQSSFSQTVASYRALLQEDPVKRIRSSDSGDNFVLTGGDEDQVNFWRTIYP